MSLADLTPAELEQANKFLRDQKPQLEQFAPVERYSLAEQAGKQLADSYLTRYEEFARTHHEELQRLELETRHERCHKYAMGETVESVARGGVPTTTHYRPERHRAGDDPTGPPSAGTRRQDGVRCADDSPEFVAKVEEYLKTHRKSLSCYTFDQRWGMAVAALTSAPGPDVGVVSGAARTGVVFDSYKEQK